jgi:hypothetical protein
MTAEPTTLEEALQTVERDLDSVIKALGAALKEAKRAKGAAATGQLRDLQQSLDGSVRLVDQAASVTMDVRAGWRFDVGSWFASGDYTKELLTTAAEVGVQAFESDERILSYPVIVAVSAVDTTVVVDKKKERRVRPSVVARQLLALQQRPPKFKPDPFIASLAAAYDLVAGAQGIRRGTAVKLVDVHGALTLLPGAARDYTRPEFTRDLYLLERTGVVDTRDGRRMSLPASALTRGTGVLTTVTQSGQTKVYAGIAFGEPLT